MSTNNPPDPDQMQTYYGEMSSLRRRIVGPLAVATLAVFLIQLWLANFTSVLDGEVFPGMTWAYLVGFATFFLVLIGTVFYRRQMDRLENRFGSIRQVATEGEA